MNKKPLLGSPTPQEYEALLNKAAELAGCHTLDLLSPKRGRAKVANWRMALYYVLRQRGATFSEIGLYFGGRTHGTIMHGCKATQDQIDVHPQTKDLVASLAAAAPQYANQKQY